MTNPNQLTQQELQAWQRCKEVGEDFTRLSHADQLILTQMIKRQLTQGSAHFRQQFEAWLAANLGEEATALMVKMPQRISKGIKRARLADALRYRQIRSETKTDTRGIHLLRAEEQANSISNRAVA